MTWFKVDDELSDHPKVRRLGRDKAAAMGVWVLAGAWAGRHDSSGFVPDEVVTRFGPQRLAARLVEVGLWERTEVDGEDGYAFHDWFDVQPSVEEIERKKEQNRERQRRHRRRRAGLDAPAAKTETVTEPAEDGDASRNALRNASVTLPRPDPTRPGTSSSTSGEGSSGSERTRAAQRPPAQPKATKDDQQPELGLIHRVPPLPDQAPRCARHAALPAHVDPPPCRPCKGERERWEGLQASADAEAEAEQQTTLAAQRTARSACTACDEFGWLLQAPSGPPVEPAVRCRHQARPPTALAASG